MAFRDVYEQYNGNSAGHGQDDQSSPQRHIEASIVFLANAGVQPPTMVVKVVDALVADPTVLGFEQREALAMLAMDEIAAVLARCGGRLLQDDRVNGVYGHYPCPSSQADG